MGNRADQMEERISDLEDRNLGNDWGGRRKRTESFKKWNNSMRTIWLHLKSNIRIMGIPEGEKKEKGTGDLFKQITDENFPNLWKEVDPWISEANRTPNYLNGKRPSPQHVILKVLKVNDKERILKTARANKDLNQ